VYWPQLYRCLNKQNGIHENHNKIFLGLIVIDENLVESVDRASLGTSFSMPSWWPCRFTVAEWLMYLAAALEVMGSGPSLDDIYKICFLESIQSPAQRDFKWYV